MKNENHPLYKKSNVFIGTIIALIPMIVLISVASITGYFVSVLNLTNETNYGKKNITLQASELSDSEEQVSSSLGYHKERLLLRFKKGVSEKNAKSLYKRFGIEETDNIENLRVLKVPENALEKIKTALSHNPNVEFVEYDYIAKIIEVPNDPSATLGYYVTKMDYTGAWDISKGLTTVRVANPDTGIDMDHPDLANVLLDELAYNSYEESSFVEDYQGHGTATAGCIGADTNNATGLASAEWYKEIIPIKITNTIDGGYAYYSDMYQAAIYAADQGAKIVSISFGGGCSSTLNSAGAYVKSKGGLFFMSAGNEGAYICNDTINHDDVIIVSATDSTDTKASWSNYGPDVDIAAPGVSIYTTKNGGTYGYYSGTSFSSPLAASVAALLFSVHPEATNTEIQNALFSGADDLGEAGKDDFYGYGRINARKSLEIMDQPIVDTTAPSISINLPLNNQIVTADTDIEVSAIDLNGINNVKLYIDGVLIDTAYGDSDVYTFRWIVEGYDAGIHAIEAIATDNYGNINAEEITVNLEIDNTEPEISITYPAEGETISDKFLIVTTQTSDNTQSVDFYINGVYKETDYATPFTMSKLNTTPLVGQTVTIKAIAYTTSGVAMESTVNFQIAGESTEDPTPIDPTDPVVKPQCSDGKDNDLDKTCDYNGCAKNKSIWYPADPDCTGPDDTSESS